MVGSGCNCKVGRVIRRRELAGVDEELAERWARGEESLRDLARQFALAVLEDAARTAGMTPLEGELDNLYRLLTDDEVTSGMRRQARDRLERGGVDPDAVESDFVSHQTVHTHLRECVGVERSTEGGGAETESDRVRSLQTRLEAVTTDAVDRLDANDHLDVGAVDVYVELSVVCEDCGTRREFGRLLDDGGCECRTAEGRE